MRLTATTLKGWKMKKNHAIKDPAIGFRTRSESPSTKSHSYKLTFSRKEMNSIPKMPIDEHTKMVNFFRGLREGKGPAYIEHKCATCGTHFMADRFQKRINCSHKCRVIRMNKVRAEKKLNKTSL